MFSNVTHVPTACFSGNIKLLLSFFFLIEEMSQALGLRVLDVIKFFFLLSTCTSDQLINPRGKTHMQHYGRHGAFLGYT